MSSSSALTTTISGKRSRSKVGISSEDETNVSKRPKLDCCQRVKDSDNMNKSRIYNFGYRKKPAELFRKDLISAMKMADTEQLNREEYLPITESWREEWEKGVQVAVNPDNLPEPVVKVLRECETTENAFKLPKKLIKSRPETEPIGSNYELDLQDLCWLEAMAECDNTPQMSDNNLEEVINQLEQQCARNIKARQVGIEYDDHIICDVCRSPEAEDGNEMVFCDVCNICVHQACYGITDIPEGDWLCRPCKEFGSQKNISCILCPNFGGALKPTSNANQWSHVSCALWVPEVSIGCVSTMEPITKIKQIPQTRWNLVCSLCNVKQGAPIQCSVKTCKIAYHVICAFNHKLKMKAIVESDKTKGVKLKSYCKKHTEKGDIDDDGNVITLESKSESSEGQSSTSKTQHEIEIATSITEVEDKHQNDFWKYIDINKVQQELIRLNPSYGSNNCFIDFILQYWKLKRTSNYGASLIKLTSSAQFQEQQQQQRNEILRLRVDLERIRNLSYMICRREKVKRNWISSHQNTVQKSFTAFTGVNGSETPSKSVQLTDEKSRLICDIINNSFVYNFNETEDKNRTNLIVRQLRRLSKCEESPKQRPNPYAKFYISQHLKRKQENSADTTAQPVNGLPPTLTTNIMNNSFTGLLAKTETPLNGLSSPKHQIKYNSVPVNGLHNNSNSPSHKTPDKNSTINYRQSPRSLLKPKLMSPSNVINNSNKEDKQFQSLVPVLTRTALSGYKIPKKKTEQNSQSLYKLEFDETIERFKRRLNTELYPNRCPQKSPKLTFNQTNQLYETSQQFNYNNHSQGGHCMTRGVTRGKHNEFYNRNDDNNSLLRTRAQHSVDEAQLMASAKNDIDMRRHQSSGFRHSLIQ